VSRQQQNGSNAKLSKTFIYARFVSAAAAIVDELSSKNVLIIHI